MRKDLMMMLAALSVTACVEETYDLSKDIDTSVTVGSGGLTTPAIHFEPITLDNILDLEDGSDIKALDDTEAESYGLQAGDYVFAPATSSLQSSTVSTPAVTFKADGSGNMQGIVNLIPVTITQAMLDMLTNEVAQVVQTRFSIDFATTGITSELTRLDEVQVDANVQLQFNLDNADPAKLIYEPGLTIMLPDALGNDIERGTGGFQGYKLEGHTLTFTEPYTVGKSGDIALHLNSLLVSDKGESGKLHITYGKGNNDGTLEGKLDFVVNGMVKVACDQPCSIEPKLYFGAMVAGGQIEVKAIKGLVNPKVDISISGVNINDVPSCLQDDNTQLKLDSSNPMIFLQVYNGTPLTVQIDGITLSAIKNGEVCETVQTSSIILEHDKNNNIVISPKAVEGANHVACPGLGRIVALIPDRVEAAITHAGVPQDGPSIELELGQIYNVRTAYNIVAPLTLDEGSKISYETTLDGFQSELDDITEIGSIAISVEYDNKLPMNMSIDNAKIKAINDRGEEISNVKLTVEGDVKQGEGKFNVTLTQTGGSLNDFDGLKLTLDANVPVSGKTLNERQSLELKKVQLTLAGGVTLEM